MAPARLTVIDAAARQQEALQDALLAEGRPVFVDFTAAWCVTCQYNKQTTLADTDVLRDFGIEFEADVVSAHRMPHEMVDYGTRAAERGLRVIIAGAGGAAHLPGIPVAGGDDFGSVTAGLARWAQVMFR